VTRWQIPIYCVSRANICFIDTSGHDRPDLFQSYVLGVAFGLRRNAIRFEEKALSKKDKLTLWASYPYETWSDISDLTAKIANYLKTLKMDPK
jgi:hypothetical protein